MLMSGAAKPWVRAKNSEPILSCISMVRNEADIIRIFLAQALSLFDKTFIVDIQSTDGTKEIIESVVADADGRIVQFTCRTQERYQGALMNALARKAFAEGADWVFPLDADEFVDVESREALLNRLQTIGDDLVFMPWINLIPSRYGDFEAFPADQTFSCLPQPSSVSKVAISAQFALVHPDFSIEEGNHNVSRTFAGGPQTVRPGFPLLHLPIRSAARLKYKMINAQRLLDSKHNTGSDEGFHIQAVLRRLEGEAPTPKLMASLARTYGLKDNETAADSAMPSAKAPATQTPALVERRLPTFLVGAPSPAGPARSLKETLERDVQTQWEHARFGGGAPVGAEIAGSDIAIRCLPLDGEGHAIRDRYAALGADEAGAPERADLKVLTDAIAAAFGEAPASEKSEWTGLHPCVVRTVLAAAASSIRRARASRRRQLFRRLPGLGKSPVRDPMRRGRRLGSTPRTRFAPRRPSSASAPSCKASTRRNISFAEVSRTRSAASTTARSISCTSTAAAAMSRPSRILPAGCRKCPAKGRCSFTTSPSIAASTTFGAFGTN